MRAIFLHSKYIEHNMPPKSMHSQKTKKGSAGGTVKNPPKPQSVQKTDIKGFFQHSQSLPQQEGTVAAELNFASPDREVEPRLNSSPLGNMQHSTMDMEGSVNSPSWDMHTLNHY